MKNEDLTGPTFRSPSRRAGDKLERSVASLPVLPITLEEVQERATKWKVSRGEKRPQTVLNYPAGPPFVFARARPLQYWLVGVVYGLHRIRPTLGPSLGCTSL